MRAPLVVNRSALVLLALGTIGLGCTQILGLDGPYEGAGPTGSGGGGSSGGAGGDGAGGGSGCAAGATKDCYSGDPSTMNVGNCKTGSQTCAGGAWGMCVGDVLPVVEVCNGLDDDCDGTIDNGCSCTDGDTQSCYSGSMGTMGVGPCKGGTQSCVGGMWGACVGEVPPTAEACNGLDDDCDGASDDGNPEGGAACMAGGQGVCAVGMMTCAGGALTCQSAGQASTEDCTTAGVDENCDGVSSCSGAYQWVKVYASPGEEHGYAVDTDASLNVVVTGGFEGSINFGGGALASAGLGDAFVVKLDAAGNHLWSKRFGGAGEDSGRAIAVDPAGNIIVAGVFNGSVDFGGGPLMSAMASMFVVKLSASGNFMWSKAFTGASAFSYVDAAADPAGNIFITTMQDGAVNYGGALLTAQGEGIAVVKLSPTGDHAWSKVFSTGTCCGGTRTAVATDDSGDVVVAAGYQGKIDFGGVLVDAVGQDAVVFKLNPAGDYLWSHLATGGNSDYATGVAVDKNGDVLVSGTFASGVLSFNGGAVVRFTGTDAFLAKLTSNGGFVWAKGVGKNGSKEEGGEVDVDSLGNIVLGGNTDSVNVDFGAGVSGLRGAFLVKYDSGGGFLWNKVLDSACCNTYPFVNLAVDGAGSTLVTGGFTLQTNFGGGSFFPMMSSDAFVAKYAP